MTSTRFILVAAALGIACTADAHARQDSSAAEPRYTRLSETAILGTIDATNTAEIAVARLAAAKASNADVRAFAEQLIRDHAAMHDTMAAHSRTAAMQARETLDATSIRARGKSLLDTLARLSGQAFDVAFVDAQVSDHQMTLQSLTAWQGEGDDAPLHADLRKAWPVIQAHYDHALALLSMLTHPGEPSVWKKHLGQPESASGRPTPP